MPTGDFVIPVDKPAGPTSHDVVARARRSLGTRRIGHTGTLDPFASGLLLLCVGKATRLAEYLSGLDKTYEAVAILGTSTDTLDREGVVLEERAGWESLTRGGRRARADALPGERGAGAPALLSQEDRGRGGAPEGSPRRGDRDGPGDGRHPLARGDVSRASAAGLPRDVLQRHLRAVVGEGRRRGPGRRRPSRGAAPHGDRVLLGGGRDPAGWARRPLAGGARRAGPGPRAGAPPHAGSGRRGR